MNTSVKQKVIAALKKCQDPELGIDIYRLGLIYQIAASAEKIEITMTLTTPGCPLASYFKQLVIDRVKAATGVKNIQVDITFDPPWTPDKISPTVKTQLAIFK